MKSPTANAVGLFIVHVDIYVRSIFRHNRFDVYKNAPIMGAFHFLQPSAFWASFLPNL